MKLKLLIILIVCSVVGPIGCSKKMNYNENQTTEDNIGSIVYFTEPTENNTESSVGYTEPKDETFEFLKHKIIRDKKIEMEKQGWENISIDQGWGDWEAWGEGGAYIPPSEQEEKMNMYTLWGEVKGQGKIEYDSPDNNLEIIVQIVFDEENPNGYIYNVFYTSGSGRYLDSDEFVNDFLENNEILSTNTESLWDFMYSY